MRTFSLPGFVYTGDSASREAFQINFKPVVRNSSFSHPLWNKYYKERFLFPEVVSLK
jgi:hypothetical protein